MTEGKLNRRRFVKLFGWLLGGALFSSGIITMLRSSIPFIREATLERESVLSVEGRDLTLENIPVGEGVNATYLGFDYKGKEQEHSVVVVHLKPEDIKEKKFVVQDIVAFSAVCKHLGCTAFYRFDDCRSCITKPEFRHDGTTQLIYCPCHFSQYDPYDASKVVFGPAPEPLDPLEIKVMEGKVYGLRILKYREGLYD